MNGRYRLAHTADVITPALVVFRELVDANLLAMIAMAGTPARLRPHCKTHKMAAVTRRELALGILKHKCATLAEAEMLAQAGAADILLAYNVVGANVARVARFVRQYPGVQLCVLADHPAPLLQLSAAMQQSGQRVGVLLDLDVGMHRTGIAVGPEAKELYARLASLPGLEPAGLHAYDGQHTDRDPAARRAKIEPDWQRVLTLRDELIAARLPVPRIVVGGTPGFPVHAAHQDPALELSPGTTVFFDAASVVNFPDLPFVPAALVLTRVVSRPASDLVTFDVGTKGIAADPPLERRVQFPDLPDAQIVAHNEEHLVVRTASAERFSPGDEQLVIPWHVCPTCAWHREAHIVAGGEIVERWEVTARDRCLSL